jgi:Family of unknown function (DUF5317)
MTLPLVYLAGALLVGACAFWLPVPRFRAWPLLALAALPQAVTLIGMGGPLPTLLSGAALALWGWENRAIPGIALIIGGSLLNLGTMLVHGGAMPIHPATLARIGIVASPGMALAGSKDVVADLPATALLGDWIILPLERIYLVVSPGDLLVVAGISAWLFAGHQEQRSAHPVAKPGAA